MHRNETWSHIKGRAQTEGGWEKDTKETTLA
jgi:hypothetical protein